MKISLENISKKYNTEYIFKNVNLEFEQANSYAIVGGNGTGKSTLLSIVSGYSSPSKGKIQFFDNESKLIDGDDIFRYLAFTAPYIDLVEEFTLREMFNFYFQLASIQQGETFESFVQHLYLEAAVDKQIKNFSSGMKQRLKLGLVIFTDKPILLLDEPTTNLDEKGIAWYLDMINERAKNKLLIISSNIAQEYSFVNHIISTSTFEK